MTVGALLRSAWCVFQRNLLVYRHVWRGSLFMGFLSPLLFLLSMGLGVGALVRTEGLLPAGASFLTFLGSGLLASTCMQTGSFESSFPIVGKMAWRRNYEAMFATPVSVGAIVLGELLWLAARLVMVAAAFACVLAAFGVGTLASLVPAVAAAVLTGLAFGACVMAYAATLRDGANFNALFRFGITPLFLFSGVFFPITRLPAPIRWLAPTTPLFHGVELTRGLVLGTLGAQAAVIHAAYLVVMAGLGASVAYWIFRRRLWT